MALDIIALTQYAIMFSVCIFFSAVAIDRKTIITNLIAAISWMTTGLINFIMGPSSIGGSISLLFWAIGFVFVGSFLYCIITSYFETKSARWSTGPL